MAIFFPEDTTLRNRGKMLASCRGAGTLVVALNQPEKITEDVTPKPEIHLAAGTHVDQYTVIRLIARGGMGDVYLALDTELGRRVALKFVREDGFASGGAPLRFKDEARAIAAVSHPSIVNVFGVGDHEGHPYVALEYIEGETLRERMKKAPPSVPEAQRIVRDVAGALAEAHRRKILHLDLKPENIMAAKDGRMRVVDFGLARSMAQRAALEEIVGTPAYMSPEQWLKLEPTEATDVWALGVIAFELFCGRLPYAIGMLTPEAYDLVTSPRPAPSPRAFAVLPDEVNALIERCLDKRPDQRPSAQHVFASIEQVLALNRRAPVSEEQSPFRGLAAFSEEHSAFFFGRENDIATFCERLRETAVLPVVGASGAGKSSFVRAGVIPRLKEREAWIVIALRPGGEPFTNLARALLSEDGSGFQETQPAISGSDPPLASTPALTDTQRARLEGEAALARELQQAPEHLAALLQRLAERQRKKVLVFVDQLEEVSTLTADPAERDAFLTAICRAASDYAEPVRVVFTLRDDFLSRLAESAALRDVLRQVTVLRNPGEEALEEIIQEPLRAVGYRFDDPQLCATITRAAHTEQLPLPLLQFTLRVLWDQRDRERRMLLASVYEEIGGIGGAVANYADEVLVGLDETQRGIARDLMLRLVTPERMRRVQSEQRLLEGLPPDAARVVLQRLTQARLITVHRRTTINELELAHESLVQRWGRLSQWIDESKEELVLLAEISQTAELWQKRGERPDETWSGDALFDAKAKLARVTTPVPAQVERFLAAGEAHTRLLLKKAIRHRRYLFLSLSLMTALPVLAIGWYQARHLEAAQIVQSDRETSLAARAIARELSQWLSDHLSATEAAAAQLSALPVLDNELLLEERGVAQVFRFGSFGPLCAVYDDTGRGLLGYPNQPALRGTDYSDREYFRRSRITRHSVISNVLAARAAKIPMITVTSPILTGSEFRGLVGCGLSLGSLQPLADAVITGLPGMRAVILDRAGVALVHPEPEVREHMRSLGAIALFRPTGVGMEEVRAGIDDTGTRVRATALSIDKADVGWTVIVSRPEALIARLSDAARRETAITAAVALAIGLLLSAALARRLGQVRASD